VTGLRFQYSPLKGRRRRLAAFRSTSTPGDGRSRARAPGRAAEPAPRREMNGLRTRAVAFREAAPSLPDVEPSWSAWLALLPRRQPALKELEDAISR